MKGWRIAKWIVTDKVWIKLLFASYMDRQAKLIAVVYIMVRKRSCRVNIQMSWSNHLHGNMAPCQMILACQPRLLRQVLLRAGGDHFPATGDL